MELTIQVDDSLARKIKGLSVLTGKNSSDITGDLSSYIETHITQQLIQAVGIKPEDLITAEQRSGISYQLDEVKPVNPSVMTITNKEGEVNNYVPPTNNALTFPDEEEDEDNFNMADGLGAEESKFKDFDDPLPDHLVEKLDNKYVPEMQEKEEKQELILPTEENEEEELLMAIKDVDGNDSGYNDTIMNDFQDELESGELDGISDDDFPEDDDESQFDIDQPQIKRKARVSANIPSDAPAAEGYENVAPDVLPMDYGIDQVSSEDGQVGGAMDFFNNAFDGREGDKSARNNVVRKRIITDF